jgi:hypothetical protein
MVGPTNGRGYKDLPTSPTLGERTESILRIADWLLARETSEENACPVVDNDKIIADINRPFARPAPPIGFPG